MIHKFFDKFDSKTWLTDKDKIDKRKMRGLGVVFRQYMVS